MKIAVLSQSRVEGTCIGRRITVTNPEDSHSPIANWANIAQGVTIDLALLNQITLSSDNRAISIGPGNRWEDVYKKLDPLHVAVAGGRVGDVGVAGLITGGGISFFTPRYGMVCDNVLNYEVNHNQRSCTSI
jgi:FAD/FMN-containing dehydrogenase